MRAPLSQAARATALPQKRDYVTPDDVVNNVIPVCAHRIVARSYTHDGDVRSANGIMQQIIETLPSPA